MIKATTFTALANWPPMAYDKTHIRVFSHKIGVIHYSPFNLGFCLLVGNKARIGWIPDEAAEQTLTHKRPTQLSVGLE